ncbi:MAG: DUF5591 domain-containing protein [Methanolinea sp.]
MNVLCPPDPPFFLPAFEEAYRYIISTYRPPARDIAVFLPCALRKPYSTSPSHRTFRSAIASVLPPGSYHVVVFGTCGVVPEELERMYPFAHYRYMLGKCRDRRVLDAFLEIETYRLAGYLEKTRDTYKRRVAYCIGPFREAMRRASERTGIELDLLFPTDTTIRLNSNPERSLPAGSLSMPAYVDEFVQGLSRLAGHERTGREDVAARAWRPE